MQFQFSRNVRIWWRTWWRWWSNRWEMKNAERCWHSRWWRNSSNAPSSDQSSSNWNWLSNNFIRFSSMESMVSPSEGLRRSQLTSVTSNTRWVACFRRQWEDHLKKTSISPRDHVSKMKIVKLQEWVIQKWIYHKNQDQSQVWLIKALCVHHTEIGEFENLFRAQGESFRQSLAKITKEYSKIKVAEVETPVNEDRRNVREIPARKVRRKLINYRDLDRSQNDGPDLRNEHNLCAKIRWINRMICVHSWKFPHTFSFERSKNCLARRQEENRSGTEERSCSEERNRRQAGSCRKNETKKSSKARRRIVKFWRWRPRRRKHFRSKGWDERIHNLRKSHRTEAQPEKVVSDTDSSRMATPMKTEVQEDERMEMWSPEDEKAEAPDAIPCRKTNKTASVPVKSPSPSELISIISKKSSELQLLRI